MPLTDQLLKKVLPGDYQKFQQVLLEPSPSLGPTSFEPGINREIDHIQYGSIILAFRSLMQLQARDIGAAGL